MRVRAKSPRLLVAATCLAVLTTGACGNVPPTPTDGTSRAAAESSPSDPVTSTTTKPGVAMTRPAALTKPLLSPDLLINSQDPLSESTVDGIRDIKGVTNIETFSLGMFYSEERQVTYAAVNPATYRRYTPSGSAQTLAVWDRVAGGEMAIRPRLGRTVQDKDGFVRMGNDKGSPDVHIGAYAEMVPPRLTGGAPYVDAVVNQNWAERLHMKKGNAMLVSTGGTSPQSIQKKLRRIAGKRASVRILGPDLDIHATQTAVLTGGSVSNALGTLNYTANANGTVNPDPAWVANFIRTEDMPILGRVTCNRIMLPELRAALNEIVGRGLADKIHPGEYGGCFVPRFIAGTRSLSFHTFGTAIDLNVPGNGRGTVGQMDREVVKIFKKWGFAWGGDWSYTDPMHFELHTIVKPT